MSDGTSSTQDTCGCCVGTGVQSPSVLDNRPGLSAIAYRIGTHGEILATLLAGLSSKDLRAVAKLRTRDTDDFSIALLDAYACMADVLTFYQERIANESYLRTAGERLSFSELARLVGYRLKPGVAAETYLAFTLQEPPPQAAGSEPKEAYIPTVGNIILGPSARPASSEPKQASGVPDKVKLPAGIQAQSVPGPDEKPQIFETSESIEARPAWNALKPKMSELKSPVSGDTVVYFRGTATRLKPGDTLLFVGEERKKDPDSKAWDFRRVAAVETDAAADRTKVTLDRGLGAIMPYTLPPQNPTVYAMRLRASLFGYNAPDWRVMSDEIKRGYLGLKAGQPMAATEWPGFTIAGMSDPPDGATGSGLYAEYFNTRNLTQRKRVRNDATINFKWINDSPFPDVIGSDNFSVRWTGWLQSPVSGEHLFHTRSDDGVRLWVDNQLIVNNWTDHAAADNDGSIWLDQDKKYNIRLEFYENTGVATIQLYWTPPGHTEQIIPTVALFPRDIHTVHLDASYPQIVPGFDSWLVLSSPETVELYQIDLAVEDSRACFTLTGKTTRLKLKGEHLADFNEKLRSTVVFAQNEILDFAEIPKDTAVNGNQVELNTRVDGLLPGRKLIVSGRLQNSTAEKVEVVTLKSVMPNGDVSILTFEQGLVYSYQLETVAIYANVAGATHGETVHQILGSGSAQQSHQRYQLKHAPLTFVGTENETGAKAALEVRVNDILWHEATTLHQAGVDDRAYVLRVGEDGAGQIQFGDGRHGARLPTGQENLRAVYRKGIGVAGDLKAGQISQLLTRPLGLKAVSNPLPTEGGVDADSVEDARRNLPLGVRTLGRVVSVRDYEDFARAYTGIAKAQATVLNTRAGRTIFVTVGGIGGTKPATGSPTLTKLLKALKESGDPLVRCELKAYQRAFFRVGLRVKAAPDYDIGHVLKDVEAALRAAFSFDARDFAQTVARSEVIAVAQKVKGVLGIDLDRFYRDGDTEDLKERLTPSPAQVGKQGNATAAELLLLHADPLDSLEVML